MKLRIFTSVLAASLACLIAVPAVAAAETTHESTSTCRIDESTGLTYCFTSEVDIKTKQKHSGASDVKMSGTSYATVTDATGYIVSSYEASILEHSTVLLASDGSTENVKVNVLLTEEITEGGISSCTRTHVVIRGDSERLNAVTTVPGPC
jgi:hypothetical protein